jgi:hypothetical protein
LSWFTLGKINLSQHDDRPSVTPRAATKLRPLSPHLQATWPCNISYELLTISLLNMSIPSIISLVTLFTSLNLAVPQVLANYEHNHHLHKRHHQLAGRGKHHEARSDGSSIPPAAPVLKSRNPFHVKRYAAEYSLLGCFSELSDGTRLLSDVDPWNSTSIQTCVESCYSFSSIPFVYAGIFNGNECRCANDISSSATQVSQANCKTQCAARTDGWCGGPNAYQIYKAPFSPAPPAESTAAINPT